MTDKCEYCGKEITRKVWFQRYCSDRCRVAAMRKRKKQKAADVK